MNEINNREWGFYIMAMIAIILVELVPIAYLLVMPIIMFVSLKYIFPSEPKK